MNTGDITPLPAFVAVCEAITDRPRAERLFAHALRSHDSVVRHTINTVIQSNPDLRSDAYQEAALRLWQRCLKRPEAPMGEGLLVRITRLSTISLTRKASARHTDAVSLDELVSEPITTAAASAPTPDGEATFDDVPAAWIPILEVMATDQWTDSQIGIKFGMAGSSGRRSLAVIRKYYRERKAA